MTDDAFEALWFLYSASRRNLAKMAGSSSTRTSTLTFFERAIRSAIGRSNDVDAFLKAFQSTADLHFSQNYPDALPSTAAMQVVFLELKRHGTLAFMPRLVERVQERREQVASSEELEDADVEQ